MAANYIQLNRFISINYRKKVAKLANISPARLYFRCLKCKATKKSILPKWI